MSFIVDNCPRCNAALITFDVKAYNLISIVEGERGGSTKCYEIYCVCKSCKKGTIFITYEKKSSSLHENFILNNGMNLNSFLHIVRPVTPADISIPEPPEFLPPDINNAFIEGTKCLAIGCYNAAATMFRLCLDYATKGLLPEGDEPNQKVKRSLGLRMEWLFEQKILPEVLRELAQCVKEDGNDGAHEGTLDKESAEDLEEFTRLLLERLYTEPQRLIDAKKRREERRNKDIALN